MTSLSTPPQPLPLQRPLRCPVLRRSSLLLCAGTQAPSPSHEAFFCCYRLNVGGEQEQEEAQACCWAASISLACFAPPALGRAQPLISDWVPPCPASLTLLPANLSSAASLPRAHYAHLVRHHGSCRDIRLPCTLLSRASKRRLESKSSSHKVSQSMHRQTIRRAQLGLAFSVDLGTILVP